MLQSMGVTKSQTRLSKWTELRLQQWMNQELPAVIAGFRKGRRIRDQIANIHWTIEKAREFKKNICLFQFSCWVVLPPCPSPNPGVHPNSCTLNQWWHPIISSSAIPFSSHLHSFPASGSFQMNQLFISGGQSIGVSASTLVLPMNIQDWFPLGRTGGSPCSPRDSQECSPTPQFKSINSLMLSFLYSPILTYIHDYWEKSVSWLDGPLLAK